MKLRAVELAGLTRTRRIAWGTWAVTVAAIALGVSLLFANRMTAVPVTAIGYNGFWSFAALTFTGLAFASVGALLASARPGNAIGWLLCGIGMLAAAELVGSQYAIYGLLTDPGSLPRPELGAWLYEWTGFVAACVTATFVLMLFPDGRLLSPAWRPLPWLAGIGIVLTENSFALRPGRLLLSVYVDNPLGIAAASDAIFTVGLLGLCLVLAALFMSVISLAVRYRRARVAERQQIKWIAYVAAIHAVAFVIFALMLNLDPAFVALAASAIPIAIGIAILRQRLYDIDLLIKRTVVYGATSAALALVFFASILALQGVLRPLTAGSELAIAASTLGSLALFQPIRRRIQDAVNHRFDRSRYDASFTFDAFADRLRDEVDLDEVRADLLGAVRQTMAPRTRACGSVRSGADEDQSRPRSGGRGERGCPTFRRDSLQRACSGRSRRHAHAACRGLRDPRVRGSDQRRRHPLAPSAEPYRLGLVRKRSRWLRRASRGKLRRCCDRRRGPAIRTGRGLGLLVARDPSSRPARHIRAAALPDGRLPSPRWRPVAWCAAAATAAVAVGIALVPAPIPVLGIPNPFGREDLRAETLGLVGIGFVLLGFTSLLCIASLLRRYRRSSGIERQQIKWVAFASVFGVWPAVVILALGVPLGVGALIASFAAVPLPTAMTIALIRYRLYDIDLLIKRTVVYGATSAALALTFFVGILALQALLRPLTSGSELSVAASTLLSFVLFQPIRRRIQAGVDRRFDRSRYSAARTLEAFAEQLRDEVDLDALRGDLIGAVERTMAPAHASVWLRSGGAGSRNDFRTAGG